MSYGLALERINKAPYADSAEPASPRALSARAAPRSCEVGGLYATHEVQLLSKELHLREETPRGGNSSSAGSLAFPETAEYASALRTLTPSDLRSFSKRLQESNQRVKEMLYTGALSEKHRRAIKPLSSRNSAGGCVYDPQTGRPLNSRRSLSSPAGKKYIEPGEMKSPNRLGSNHVRIVAPSYSGGGSFHLPLPSSKGATPLSKKGEIMSTPATSVGANTPVT